ncbi:MAG: [FeFe] hydrogenase H-cluster maturation GTPase HydF [Lachnospiraceae bacterium]|nr:[FeFe] hydrogenase H-cluster maturation GTPase HydF [Lachnospiraceae bacterium]
MFMNETPMANRKHIAFLGRTNAGKSSVVNAVTGQSLAIVSDVKGTTTDPVFKTMELLPIGPVVIIDTPGLDDKGELGKLRIEKTYQVLAKTDIAVVVIDSGVGVTQEDIDIIQRIKEYEIPVVIVFNKIDALLKEENNIQKYIDKINEMCDFDRNVKSTNVKYVMASATNMQGIDKLKETIGGFNKEESKSLIGDVVNKGDFVILVVPIDEAAPKGRIILPQQMVIRELLDIGATAIVVKDTEYKDTLERLEKPKLVITDSQAFGEISQLTPEDIELTSFSILLARAKGNLDFVVKSAGIIDEIEDGDCVLISEGCTHHRQCDDIGTVKIPNLLRKRTGKNINFEFTSGREFPEDLSKYKLIIHCGGCMLNDKEIKYRQNKAMRAGIPMTNYGIAIAYMKGILDRSVSMFIGR